eukprot:7331849-Prymnesium_polylepis.1
MDTAANARVHLVHPYRLQAPSKEPNLLRADIALCIRAEPAQQLHPQGPPLLSASAPPPTAQTAQLRSLPRPPAFLPVHNPC